MAMFTCSSIDIYFKVYIHTYDMSTFIQASARNANVRCALLPQLIQFHTECSQGCDRVLSVYEHLQSSSQECKPSRHARLSVRQACR